MSLPDRIRRFFLRCQRGNSKREPDPERRDIEMGSEVDFFGLAGLLISQHGANAMAYAARLTQEAMQDEDSLAVTDWRAVEQAIALLANDAPVTRH
jgi:hypothetical protein